MTANATCNGNITVTGGENCSSRGFEWGTTLGGPYPNSWTESGSFGTGTFSHQFTGLTDNTLIYYRAKAQNSAGWGYGGEQSFTTWNQVSATDSCSGADTPSMAASLPSLSDSGSASDVLVLQGQIPFSDVCAGDDEIPNITLPLVDSGAGADAVAPQATLTVSEAGAGLEADVVLQVQFTIIDPGTGLDQVPNIAFTLVDSGAGVDVVAPQVTLSVSDNGTGLETDVVLQAQFTIIDAGTGSEYITLASQALTLYDSGVAVDISALDAALAVVDAGSGADLWAFTYVATVIDSGEGTDIVITLSAAFMATDFAVGSDVWAMAAGMIVVDSGSGLESPSISISFTVTDSTLGSDLPTVQGQINISDVGSNSDVWTLAVSFTIGDSGTGLDYLWCNTTINATDFMSGSEVCTIVGLTYSYDSGALVSEIINVMLTPLIAYDSVLGIDISYRVQGEISLDGALLPHVLNIQVDEPSIVQDLPVMDALPYRKQLGKQGRHLVIQGWTDSLATLEALRGYADGEKHLLVLPTGDSMNVHIVNVRTPETAEDYQTYNYEMDVLETVD